MKFALLSLVCGALAAQVPSFDYPHPPLEIAHISAVERGAVSVEDITFQNLEGGQTAAYLVHPPGKGRGRGPGALFVHWYGPPSPTSNRTQFLEEAVELAQGGLTSLLVETPWSDPKWYDTRDVSQDFEFSVQEVKELRRDLDVLLAQPRVDPKRIAYVGHDFGAMYGMIVAAVDQRISVAAFQAGNPSFGEWFLYNQQNLTAVQKSEVILRLDPLAPVHFIGKLRVPVLMQFAKKDFFVPLDRAQGLFNAATGPKRIEYYDGGHELNPQASSDRIRYLRDKLGLK